MEADHLLASLVECLPNRSWPPGLCPVTLLVKDTLELSGTFLVQSLLAMLVRAGHKVIAWETWGPMC